MTQLTKMRETTLRNLENTLFSVNHDLDNFSKLTYYCNNRPDGIKLFFEYWYELKNLQLILEKTEKEFQDKTYDILDKLKSTN